MKDYRYLSYETIMIQEGEAENTQKQTALNNYSSPFLDDTPV